MEEEDGGDDDVYACMLKRVDDPDELVRIQAAWDAPPGQKIIAAAAGAGGSDIEVFGKHTQRLRPASWLFDEVINV